MENKEELANAIDSGGGNQATESFGNWGEEPTKHVTPKNVSSLEVAKAIANKASYQQATDLASTYMNESVAATSKELLQENMAVADKQLQAIDDLQQALKDQEETYAKPGLVRLFGQLFDYTLSDNYHMTRVNNAAKRVQTYETIKQINAQKAQAKAQDAVGYNVLADPMVDKARNIIKDLDAQRMANEGLELQKQALDLKRRELATKRNSPADIKKEIELAEYQVNAATEEAQAKELLSNRGVIESMNMGTLRTPDVDLGFRLIESSANQPTITKNALISKGLKTVKDSIKQQVDMLPSQIDKDMVSTRITNQGVLRNSDTSLASNYYYANFDQRSATASIEGDMLESSKPKVTEIVKQYYDNLSDSNKNSFNSLSGLKSGQSAMDILAALSVSVKKQDNAASKLIPYNDLLAKSFDEPIKVTDSSGNVVQMPSIRKQYANKLALNYGDFYLDRVADAYRQYDNPRGNKIASSLNVIKNGKNKNNNDKLAEAVDMLVSNGETYNGVSNFISGYADQGTIGYWANNYKYKAASYDNQASAMMPLLGFDSVVLDIAKTLNGNKLQKFYNQLLANAKSAIDKRDQELINLEKANANGRPR